MRSIVSRRIGKHFRWVWMAEYIAVKETSIGPCRKKGAVLPLDPHTCACKHSGYTN